MLYTFLSFCHFLHPASHYSVALQTILQCYLVTYCGMSLQWSVRYNSAFISQGSKRCLGRKIEPGLFLDHAALASQPSEVFSIGAEPDMTRKLPSEMLMGKEASGRPFILGVHFSIWNVPPLAHHTSPALYWKPLPQK